MRDILFVFQCEPNLFKEMLSLNSLKSYLEILFYLFLVCFFVPIKIKNTNNIESQFKKYVEDFNKSYSINNDYNPRLKAFQESLNLIEYLNANRGSNSAHYGLTKYSDMLPDEFLNNQLLPNLFKIIPNQRINNEVKRSKNATLPKKIDWRDKGVVTEVQSQKNCGACWAFAAVETIESMYALKTGNLEHFSVQEMIDCARNNNGCNGGDVCSLLEWIKSENITVMTENQYPLSLENGNCKKVSSDGVKLVDYSCLSFVHNEDEILHLLAFVGPVAAAVDAQTWQHYLGGIIQFHCPSDSQMLNHAVQIVGYDLTSDIPYYIVRNSWGTDFGDNGYLYIAIGHNLCGLAYEVSALTVN